MNADGCSSRSEIKGIIFDFGRVIYDFDFTPFAQKLADMCGMDPKEVHQRVALDSKVEWDYMEGSITSAEFLKEVSRLCGREFDEATFVEAFTNIFTPIESTMELIRELKPHYKLGLISDTSDWHFEGAIRLCPIFPLFDSVTLSYQMKLLKPDPRMYADALTRLELKADECVFIDDRPENAQGARNVGIHGIVYTGHESLLEELGKLGVKLPTLPSKR